MPQKRPLSDLIDDNVIVVLTSCSDIAAKALRCDHNLTYLYDEKPNSSSTSRLRTDRDATPQHEPVPAVKIMIKFSHAPKTMEGFSFGSSSNCNIMFEDGQQHSMSRTHFCFRFDETTKAIHLSDVSSYGTDLVTATFLRSDNESRVTSSSVYSLLNTSVALSENDEIRAGSMVLRVLVIRRPEPQTSAWVRYVDKVDTFLRQCTKIKTVRRKESGLPTVLESTILGSLGSAGKGSYGKVYKMIDTRGRLYGVKVPLHNGVDDIIKRELDCLKRLDHVSSTAA